MSSAGIYRAKADDLLRQATTTSDMGERSRLISEAVRWHAMANAADDAARSVDDIDETLRLWDEPDPPEPEA